MGSFFGAIYRLSKQLRFFSDVGQSNRTETRQTIAIANGNPPRLKPLAGMQWRGGCHQFAVGYRQ